MDRFYLSKSYRWHCFTGLWGACFNVSAEIQMDMGDLIRLLSFPLRYGLEKLPCLLWDFRPGVPKSSTKTKREMHFPFLRACGGQCANKLRFLARISGRMTRLDLRHGRNNPRPVRKPPAPYLALGVRHSRT